MKSAQLQQSETESIAHHMLQCSKREVCLCVCVYVTCVCGMDAATFSMWQVACSMCWCVWYVACAFTHTHTYAHAHGYNHAIRCYVPSYRNSNHRLSTSQSCYGAELNKSGSNSKACFGETSLKTLLSLIYRSRGRSSIFCSDHTEPVLSWNHSSPLYYEISPKLCPNWYFGLRTLKYTLLPESQIHLSVWSRHQNEFSL